MYVFETVLDLFYSSDIFFFVHRRTLCRVEESSSSKDLTLRSPLGFDASVDEARGLKSTHSLQVNASESGSYPPPHMHTGVAPELSHLTDTHATSVPILAQHRPVSTSPSFSDVTRQSSLRLPLINRSICVRIL